MGESLRREAQTHRHVDRDRALDDRGVGGEAVHELARLVAVVEGDVLAEQVEEELPPQARDEALARVRE